MIIQEMTKVIQWNNSLYLDGYAYQFYTNKHGKFLSADYIRYQGANYTMDVSFYYQYQFIKLLICSYVLSNCESVDEGMKCDRYCESVWLRFIRTDGHFSSYIPKCDPIFQKQFANIMYDIITTNRRK